MKHDYKNPLDEAFAGAQSHHVKERALTLESFLFFTLSLSQQKTCVLVSRDIIEWIVVLLKHQIPDKALCFLDKEPSFGDFENIYNNVSNISIQALSNRIFSPVCFVQEDVAKSMLLPSFKNNSLNIKEGCLFEDLVDWLNNNGFVLFDSPLFSPGGYYINGGVIDICPFHTQSLYRISFLEEFCSVFIVNKTTNKIKKKLPSLLLFPERKQRKEPLLQQLTRAGYVITKYNDSVLGDIKDVQKKTIKTIEYQYFIKKIKNKPFVFLPFDAERGFVYENTAFIPPWFQRANKPKQTKSILGGFDSLRVGGIYIHEDFGLCQFMGLEKNNKQERVCLRFLDGIVKLDVHYLPKLSFFSNQTDTKLNHLNRPGVWNNQKNRAIKEAEEYVQNIIKTYSYRDLITQVPLKTQDPLIDEFVMAFQHQDTQDQAQCWQDILNDFKKNKPMNRLVCGDVGFGKTEIAIRAAFVAVLSGLSVVVLAPTTILTKQLQHSFLTRLQPFGVSVKSLSSLSLNQTKNIGGFINKKIDVLIGTSSLLYHPKILKRCGLFIVDEEHRFGVKDKEAVLQLNPSVNFLSLSATPIPRSLELSLNKIRSISLIQTPPIERKPIICFVSEFDIKVVSSAILKEIGRGGQVFFVDNSVENLHKIERLLLKKIPNISMRLIFSNLQKKKLVGAMDGFISGKTQVLLSTTIIESGIDIGQANTIIINNAHLFGLSQLYQLRGRVGRSSSQAFAWFLFPLKKHTGDAKKRIESIIKNTSLGAGYDIALSDLEIRGSGSLFGYRQSGGGGVGFEYYSKLLSLASQPKNKTTCVVDIFNTSLDKYITNEGQRGFFYKSVLSSGTKKEIIQIEKDFLSFFGSTPKPFLLLLKTQKIALLAANKKIIKIAKKEGFIILTFLEKQAPGFLDFILPYISSFFNQKKIAFNFLINKKNFTFQYKSVGENDYILLVSFFNKLSF